ITALPYAAGVPTTLPLFPLNVVLVPGLVLPLHIFEPRYRALVEELLAGPDQDAREFGIVGVREGRTVEADGRDALFPVGTTAIVRQAERLHDGRFDIVTTGGRRFRIASIDLAEPLVRGEVDFLTDVEDAGDVALASLVARAFLAYRSALGGQVAAEAGIDPGSADDLPDDPTVLSYLVTAAMVLHPDERQSLLAAPSTAARLAQARALLVRETGLIAALGAVPILESPSSSSPN
ncbi:MAG: LON peptidase substrate-binding domain-containing protein, partial [Candidatus Nanopelagicales bacterium]